MIRRHPAHISQRRQIFVGCEGKSEVGYVALLQNFARTGNLPIYLNIKELAPGAGDPLARVAMAARLIKHESATRIAPSSSFVLLDEDQTLVAPARAEAARQLAAQKNITIVWQRPCFEAVLLRHLPRLSYTAAAGYARRRGRLAGRMDGLCEADGPRGARPSPRSSGGVTGGTC